MSQDFAELYSIYRAELEDMSSDSEGKNIMQKRLREKRAQLPDLYPMMESFPEMVASAFHGGFEFLQPASIINLIGKSRNRWPYWTELNSGIEQVRLQAWAKPLAQAVLQEEGGAQFLTIAAMLEFSMRGHSANLATATAAPSTSRDDEDESERTEEGDQEDDQGRFGRDDGDDGDDYDLDEAGADWLAEQGFDRKE